MTDINAVGSSSFDPWSSALDDDDRRRTAGSPPPRAATTRDLSELPDLPDANGGFLARAARTATAPRPVLAAGVAAADVANVDSAATPAPVVQRGLDAFRAAATATYRLPDGTEVKVAAPFRLPARQERDLSAEQRTNSTSMRYAAQEGRVAGHEPELAAIASKLGIHQDGLLALHFGRGTPEQVRAVTQALLDAGKLPPGDGKPASAGARVRKMMCDYGLGFDCAGYTQQAFLSAQGLTRAQAGFANPITEGLFEPSSARFTRVAPEKAHAGDIVVLAPPPGETYGHRAIVYDRRELTGAELQTLRCTPEDRATLAAGRVSVLEVDSSWGSGAQPDKGGVERRTWLYDASSGRWGTVEGGSAARVRLSALPYGNHPLHGIYHDTENR
jgi:hypothetical protein